LIKEVHKIFRKKDLAKNIKKFDALLEELVNGFYKNSTISREALFLWVIAMNKKAIDAIKIKATEAESDIVPRKKLNPMELRKQNMERTFKIQEGAAEGNSIFQIVSQKRDIKTLPYGRLIASFSLKLFLRKLKSPLFRVNFEDPETKAQLSEYMGPLIDQLIKMMNSDISKLIQTSLKIASYIINWPVFTLKNKGKKMLRIILRVKK